MMTSDEKYREIHRQLGELKPMKKKQLGFYLHTPFCQHKCGYCDFNSWGEHALELQWQWFEGVKRELNFWLERWDFSYEVDSFFFGGGTPSLLDESVLRALKEYLFQNVPFSSDLEWSVECNPETITKEKIELFAELSVSRLSLGVQSFKERFLNKLERQASGEQNHKALGLIESFWPREWSLDLMYGLPGQSLNEWQEDLEEALQYGMQHVSAYQLTLSTPKAKKWEQKEEDLLLEYARLAREKIELNGLAQYEVSNYAKKGRECRHNLKYWELKPFLGVGPGAYSLLSEDFACFLNPEKVTRFGVHYKSPSHFERWCSEANVLEALCLKLEYRERGSHQSELLIQNLRLRKGLDLRRLNLDLKTFLSAKCLELLAFQGFFVRANDRGFEILDYLTAELLKELPLQHEKDLDPLF